MGSFVAALLRRTSGRDPGFPVLPSAARDLMVLRGNLMGSFVAALLRMTGGRDPGFPVIPSAARDLADEVVSFHKEYVQSGPE